MQNNANRAGSNSNHRRNSLNEEHTERSSSSKRSKQSKMGNMPIKLSAISESKSKLAASSIANFDHLNVETASRSSISKIPSSPQLLSLQKSRTEMSSRLTQNTNNPGCMVNYQLSNCHFREKGWTVFSPNDEDRMVDNQKKAVLCLKTSLINMYYIYFID